MNLTNVKIGCENRENHSTCERMTRAFRPGAAGASGVEATRRGGQRNGPIACGEQTIFIEQ